MKHKKNLLTILFISAFVSVYLSACKKSDLPSGSIEPETRNWDLTTNHWYPTQKAPKGVVFCSLGASAEDNMLLSSLAGLAAAGVNEQTSDEMIWITEDLPGNLYSSAKQRLNFEERGSFSTWELLDRYLAKGLVKGYVLYNSNKSYYGYNLNCSVNFATVLASMEKAVLIEASQEQKAIEKGLKKVGDAREYVNMWDQNSIAFFDKYKSKLNNKGAVMLSPSEPVLRDVAIAYNLMTFTGTQGLSDRVLSWTNPTFPILGWNSENGSNNISFVSKYGNFNPVPVSRNLPLLMAGTENLSPGKVKSLNPRNINWSDNKNYHSFIMGRGDSTNWISTNFTSNPGYWGNPDLSKYPVGWTLSAANLSMTAPGVLSHIATTQPANASMVEFGGGYQFSDVFAKGRGIQQGEILRAYAKKLNYHMSRTGVKVLALTSVGDAGDNSALSSCKIYAEELEDLVGIVMIKYSVNEDGAGKIFWVTNKRGIHIPVVTAKYSIAGSKTPSAIATSINTDATNAAKVNAKALAWTIVDPWSYYKISGTSVVTAKAPDAGAATGLTPLHWAIQRVSSSTVVVSPEELLWRIRMANYPAETQQFLQ